VDGRPFAWVDDEITDADRDWVSTHHPARAILHRVASSRSLTDQDFAVLDPTCTVRPLGPSAHRAGRFAVHKPDGVTSGTAEPRQGDMRAECREGWCVVVTRGALPAGWFARSAIGISIPVGQVSGSR
jgi:hypothetical protein